MPQSLSQSCMTGPENSKNNVVDSELKKNKKHHIRTTYPLCNVPLQFIVPTNYMRSNTNCQLIILCCEYKFNNTCNQLFKIVLIVLQKIHKYPN